MNDSMMVKKRGNAPLYIVFVVTLILVALCFALNRFLGSSNVALMGLVIPASSVNGCIQSLAFVGCFAQVLIDYKKGFRLAIVCLVLSAIGPLLATIMSRNAASLPGLLNCVIHFFSCLLISIMFKKSKVAEVTDLITGLLNRYGFEDALIQKAKQGQKCYVAYVHLDGFLNINTNLGRQYGDQALIEIARRIRISMNGTGEAFKIEGAEFALLIPEKCDCMKIVTAVTSYLEEAIIIEKDGTPVKCNLTAWVGISNNISQPSSADALMKNADVAMNYAVRNGDQRICEYNDEMRKEMLHQIEMEKLIKESLENDYFFLMYQPQFVISGKYLRGFESLLRMRLPDGTIISPLEFISVAEKSDLILDIDQYVLRKAMTQFKEVFEKTDDFFTVSVNISAKDIANPGFAERVIAMIDEIGFEAERLEIEITEYSFSNSMERTIENIVKLREHGILIALDDFGTGYTSLSQLLHLPVNLLKIDKSLIDDIEQSEINRDFIKTVIYMGHLMDCEVIAEGVETDSQLSMLRDLSCDFVQGFVWGRPMEFQKAVLLCEGEES